MATKIKTKTTTNCFVVFFERERELCCDSPDVLCGIPLFGGQLAVGRIVDGRMEYGDADVAVLVDVRMPHARVKAHAGRRVRIVGGKLDARLEVAALVEGVRRSVDGHLPFEQVVVDELDGEALQRLLVQRAQLLLQRLARRTRPGNRVRAAHSALARHSLSLSLSLLHSNEHQYTHNLLNVNTQMYSIFCWVIYYYDD